MSSYLQATTFAGDSSYLKASTIHAASRDTVYQSQTGRSLGIYYDLKGQLEQRYLEDLEAWRVKAEEADIRREAAERDNIRLTQELHFWKSKNYTVDRQKVQDTDLSDVLERTRNDVLRRSGSRQNELLNVEIDSLRNQLQEKMNEVEEWRRIYQRQGVRSIDTRSTTESQLRAYESQLSSLVLDIQDKIQLSAELQMDNDSLKLSSYKLSSVQKEIKDIRTLLNFKQDETDKLREEIARQQQENLELRRNETNLKEQEQRLLADIESLEDQIKKTNQLKEVEEELTEKQNADLIGQLKQDHEQMKEALSNKKISYAELIVNLFRLLSSLTPSQSEKEKNLAELQMNVAAAEERIKQKQEEEQLKRSEAEEWRARQKSIDQSREAEVILINKEREKSVEAIRRTHREDKAALEGKITLLRDEVSAKETLIREKSTDLRRSRLEKSTLEIERRGLQEQVVKKQLLEEAAEKQRELELQVKDHVHERTVNSLRSSSRYERTRLEEQELAFSAVLDTQTRQTIEAKERATRSMLNASEAERKEREKSIEADTWKRVYQRTEREKSLDVESARNLRKSQLDVSQRTHEVTIAAAAMNNSALLSKLDARTAELAALRATHSSLIAELSNTIQHTQRAAIEAEIWKSRADIEEREKNIVLIQRDLSSQHEISAQRRSQNIESSILRNEISHVASTISAKTDEATSWRNSYNRLYTSTFRR